MSDTIEDKLRALAERVARLEAGDTHSAEQIRLLREQFAKVEARLWAIATGSAAIGAATGAVAQTVIGG